MTTMSDDLICAKLRAKDGLLWPIPQLAATRIEELTERLAKAEAERDAAVAKLAEQGKVAGLVRIDPKEYEDGLYRTPWGTVMRVEQQTYADGNAEGECRATAAIVGWLRAVDWCSESRSYAGAFADAIERGDHITEAKP